MTQAQKALEIMESFQRDEQGFYECRNLLEVIPVGSVSFPFGNDSPDPSVVVTYDDGSSVHVGNPTQYAFPGFVR